MSKYPANKHYGLIAICLHWLIAIGFFGAYSAVYYRQWFTESGFSFTQLTPSVISLYLHMSFGITVGALGFLFLLRKLFSRNVRDISNNGVILKIIAKIVRILLYSFIIIMPATGYMFTKLDTNYFLFTEIPQFSSTEIYSFLTTYINEKQFQDTLSFIHKNSGAYLVWGIILLHIIAALYHHYIRRDNVLKRISLKG